MTNREYTLLYLATGYIIPLLPKYTAITHYKILILMLACVVMLLWANPPLKPSKQASGNADRGTFALIFGMGYLAVVAPVVEWGYFLTDRGWSVWTGIGLLMMSGGLAFRYWSLRVLGRYFTGTVQQVEAHQLIQEGPYQVVRHPSYLGALITFLGCAVLLEAWVGFVVVLTAMGIAYYFRIQAEEKLLLSAFGQAYSNYQQNTWCLVPGIY